MAGEGAVYWDASAVLARLFLDEHSPEAERWAQRPAYHFLSSLAYAEVQAVIARVKRERRLADVLVEAAQEAVRAGPWRAMFVSPPRGWIDALARRHPLRGADLWHLAAALALREELGEVVLLTFDQALHQAARGEGLAAV
jgi:predicted nucleic acid-binding protein